MKQIEKYNNVDFLGLEKKGNPVLWYTDHIVIDRKIISIGDNADLGNMDGFVYGKIGGKELVFQNGEFIEWPQTRYKDRIYGRLYDSQEYDGENYRLSYEYKGEELLFETKTDENFLLTSIFSNKSEDVMMFTSDCEKKYLFYSKTGDFLWQYTEEADDLKINWRCIPVVDDVVVIISQDCVVAKKIQGFNICTGEKLWEITNAEELVCPNTFFVSEDQHLYGCCTECAYYDEESKLIMTKLNPKNGDTESVEVGMGYSVMPYDVTMHGRQLYYTDNRRGNEIGVIDVDKRELIERVPLNIKKKVTIGAPVVTDDKVYVFIRDLKELRVYEK